MKRTVLALFCAVASLAHAGIQFNPRVIETTTPMGFKAQYLTFSENGRSITYEPPTGWTPGGGGAAIKFTPPNLTQAVAEIDQAPLAAPQNFDEETKKALRDKTLAAVPRDSQNLAVVSEELNPVVLNHNHSYEVIISYQAFGQDFMMAVIYMNMPDTQVRFRSVARKDDFETVHTAFRRSLFSWQWQ